MKKISMIFCLLMLFINSAYSQTEKGSKMIGGSGFANLSDRFFVRLSPSVGYFFLNNVSAGVEVDFSYDEFGPSTFAVGPFVRYYIGSGANRFLVEGNFAYGNYPAMEDSYSYSKNSFSVGMGIGYTRFLSKQVGIEALLNYQNITASGMRSNDRLFASLGLQVYLPNRKNKF